MLIEGEPRTDWRDLQQRVASILQESGFVVEVARPLKTARGTVEIDVYAKDPKTTPPAIYLCECKRWASNVPQAEVQTFRTIMADSGAHFGLFISARGFQKGAYNVIQHTNIHLLNWKQFQELFLERWCKRYWIPTCRSVAHSLIDYVEPVNSDAAARANRGEHLPPAEAVGLFALRMWGGIFVGLPELILGQSVPVASLIVEHRDKYRRYLPQPIANAQSLRNLLETIILFARNWQNDRKKSR